MKASNASDQPHLPLAVFLKAFQGRRAYARWPPTAYRHEERRDSRAKDAPSLQIEAENAEAVFVWAGASDLAGALDLLGQAIEHTQPP
jgi:hypothetical protein